MLEWMQRHKKYLVVTVWISALALISAGLVEWGSGGFFGGSRDSVAKVGNLEISRYEYQRAYDYIKNTKYGIPDDEEAKMRGVDSEAFRELVMMKLIDLTADDLGLIITPKEVLERLLAISEFHTNNAFDKEKYETYLARSGQKAEAFEKLYAQEIMNEKIQNFPIFPLLDLESSAVLTSGSVADDISLMVKHKSNLLSNVKIEVIDSMIDDFWNKNRANYYKPAKYEIAYIALDSKLVPIDNVSLEQFFKDNKSKYAENALKNRDENLIQDYKAEQAGFYAQLVGGFIEENIKKLGDSAENKAAIESNADFKYLNEANLKTLQDSLANATALDSNSLPLYYGEVVEDNHGIYPQMLDSLSRLSANMAKESFVKLDVIEDGSRFIIPYLIKKIDRIPLELNDVRDKVYSDAKSEAMQEKFQAIANEILSDVANGNANDMQNIGFVTLQDGMNEKLNIFGGTIAPRDDLYVKDLQNNELKYVISQIFDKNMPNGMVFLGDEKVIFYKINKQKLLDSNDMLNGTNQSEIMMTQGKIRDMRSAMFEYAMSRHKITDYRRQD